MKSTEFCYWLQGVFEVGNPTTLDERQTDLIKRHLNMVFIHEIDPSYPEVQQDKLNEAHGSDPNRPQIGGTGPNGEVLRC